MASIDWTDCCRGHTELPPELRARDDPQERGPGVCLRGGVLLPPPHPGHDPPHPLRAGSLPLLRLLPQRPQRPACGRDLDRSGALLLPSHLQSSEETRGMEVPLLHVSSGCSILPTRGECDPTTGGLKKWGFVFWA